MPRGITTDLAGRHVEDAQLGMHGQRALLRHDQQLAVGVVEESIAHRTCWPRTCEWRRPTAMRRVAIAAERDDAVDEVGRRRSGSDSGAPSKLIGRRRHLVERAAADQAVHRSAGTACASPTAGCDTSSRAADTAGRGERRAVQLLDVEPERRLLGCVLVSRQRAGHRLGRELVAKPRQIRAFCGGPWRT